MKFIFLITCNVFDFIELNGLTYLVFDSMKICKHIAQYSAVYDRVSYFSSISSVAENLFNWLFHWTFIQMLEEKRLTIPFDYQVPAWPYVLPLIMKARQLSDCISVEYSKIMYFCLCTTLASSLDQNLQMLMIHFEESFLQVSFYIFSMIMSVCN